MDTIKVYVEQMFSSLPKTTELMRLKEEILQNMEDKYNELKNDGKNENEAIGTVISEFGNINEILEEFNLNTLSENDTKKSSDSQKIKTYRMSDKQVDNYLLNNKVTRNLIAFGTMLCIFGVSLLIFVGGLASFSADFNHLKMSGPAAILGVILLLFCVCIAVTFFIIAGSKNENFEYVDKENIALSALSKAKVEALLSNRESLFVTKICLGVTLCILAVIQLLAVAALFVENELFILRSVSIMLVMIACAVYFFITGGSEKEAYQRLLQKGEFSKKERNILIETVSAFYWCLAVAIYLGSSFLTGMWGYTWIIWPVAGVSWAAIEAILKLIINREKIL